MPTSELTLSEGPLGTCSNNDNPQMTFDWDKAAEIIRERFSSHPDLVVEAGLTGDWNYTSGIIFQDGKPFLESYTFLSSNWAKPVIQLSYDGQEQEEIECFINTKTRFDEHSKWDAESLEILNVKIILVKATT